MADQLPPINPGAPAKPSRVIRTALLFSLALNMLIICAVAGFALSGRGKNGPPRGFELSLGPIAAALPSEVRGDIRRALQGRADLRPINRADARAQMGNLLETFRTEPFDPTALETFFAQARHRQSEIQQLALSALIEKVTAMSPQERAAFAGRLQAELEKQRPRRR